MKTSTSLSVQYDNIFSPFPGRQWEDGLRWVKDAGFDAVEIILSDPDLIDRRLLQKRLEQLDLPVSTISTGQAMGLEQLSLVSASRQTREVTLARLRRDIDFAIELGRPHVTIGLIRGRGGENSPEMELPLLRDSLKQIADYAEAQQVVVVADLLALQALLDEGERLDHRGLPGGVEPGEHGDLRKVEVDALQGLEVLQMNALEHDGPLSVERLTITAQGGGWPPDEPA